MAVIKAFKGMRYNTAKAGEISSLCCPPYDIISEQERLAFIKENEYNIIRLELPKEGENPYACASDILKMWQDKGIFKIEDKPAIYIYEEEFSVGNTRKSIKGIIARVQLEEFSKGIILPHEFTLSKAKEDRLNLMKATNCNFSQIYALYMDEKHTTLATIDEQSKAKADLEFTDETGVTHRLWIETDEEIIAKLVADFADRKLYIADGHHRCASAVKVGLKRREEKPDYTGDEEFNFFLSVAFPDDELEIMDYNRVVKDLNGMSREEFLSSLSHSFDVEKVETQYKPTKRHTFGMLIENDWYKLSAKEQIIDESDPVKRLDVSILQDYLLSHILDFDDPNFFVRIDFIGGIRGLGELERRCKEDMKLAFAMYPTSIGDLMSIADANLIMPPKSSWFEPKLLSGIFIHHLS